MQITATLSSDHATSFAKLHTIGISGTLVVSSSCQESADVRLFGTRLVALPTRGRQPRIRPNRVISALRAETAASGRLSGSHGLHLCRQRTRSHLNTIYSEEQQTRSQHKVRILSGCALLTVYAVSSVVSARSACLCRCDLDQISKLGSLVTSILPAANRSHCTVRTCNRDRRMNIIG